MAVTLATVELTTNNGMPEDSVQNSFVLNGALPVQGNTLPLTAAIADFYNSTDGVTEDTGLRWYMHRSLSRAASGAIVKYYDITTKLDGSAHGSPVAEDAFTLGAHQAAVGLLPTEVACVLTLRSEGWAAAPVEAPDDSDPDSGPERPRQRYTGRLYLGPLNLNAMGGGTTPNFIPTVSSEFQTAALGAASRFDIALGAIGYTWMVWSRADAFVRQVTHVQIDDAFDTQRRRGVAPTARQTLAL